MAVKNCPICGHTPKIITCNYIHAGYQRYIIRCPNYCNIMRPREINEHFSVHGWSIVVDGNLDQNELFKIWNEELARNE